MTIRIPDLPALSGVPGGDSMLAFWSSSQDRTFKATPRTLVGHYDVTLFGAKGDGTTDDTAAIQAAINACSPGGGTVYFPVGDYRHTGLAVSSRGVTLIGDTITFAYTPTRGVNLVYSGSATGDWLTVSAHDFEMTKLHLAAHASLTPTAGAAVKFSGTTNARINYCKIVRPWNGLDVVSTSRTHVDNLHVSGFLGDFGIRVFGRTGGQDIAGVYTDTTTVGAAYNGVGLLLEGNVATQRFDDHYSRETLVGLKTVAYSDGTRPGAFKLTGYIAELCAQEGLYFVDYGFFWLLRPVTITCGLVGAAGFNCSGMRFGTGGDRQVSCVIAGNSNSNGLHGYHVEPSLNRISFVDCFAGGNSITTLSAADGLFINDATSVQVLGGQYGGNNVGNVTLGRQRAGINIGAGATDTLISSADLRGNTTAPALDAGTGTKITNCLGFVAENSGTASVSPDGSGNGTISHGLSGTPTFAIAGVLGDTVTTGVEVQAVSANSIIVRIYNEATGADVTAGTFSVMWHARLAQA